MPVTSAPQRINVASAGEASGNVSFTTNAALGAFSAKNCIAITNTGSSFQYAIDAIPVNSATGERLTRDIEVYLKPLTPVKYRDYGYYAYPIRMRQQGTVTQYLPVDKVKTYADKLSFDEQYYLLGKVVSVSSIETDTYPISLYPVNPQYFYDRGAMPSLSEEQCPSNLSECFVTVVLDVDGTQVKILVNDLARDNFLGDLASTIKPGDQVEVSLLRARYDSSFGGLVNINPLAFFTK